MLEMAVFSLDGGHNSCPALGSLRHVFDLVQGLNQTNMNDAYGFALWIWADLAVIALGGGAFFPAFNLYCWEKRSKKYH